jgi:nicotinate-nucleotide adenylyltransferase
LGGTFDPIHLAHLRVAEELRERFDLDVVRFVPSAVPPHKRGRGVLAAPHRLRMVERANAGHPGFVAWDVELRRQGPSYSIDTLRTLRHEVGADARIVFALGWDAFAEIHTWREYAAIFGVCDVAIVTRPGHPTTLRREHLPVATRGAFRYDRASAGFRHASGHAVTLHAVTALDISATDIREHVRRGRSIRYLVPDAVREYIATHHLYATPRPKRSTS